MTSPLPPEIRRTVATLGVNIYWLEQKIIRYRYTENTKILQIFEAELENYRKQRKQLRGY